MDIYYWILKLRVPLGQYLQWCLEGFDTGLECESVLQKANERCAQQWGTDKVTN